MWARALEDFASQYCTHFSPPKSELSRVLLMLSRENAPHLIQSLLAKLNVPREFVFTSGKELAIEFISMLVRKKRHSFLYYISTGQFAPYISNKSKRLSMSGLANLKHWKKAVHLYEMSNGSIGIPPSFINLFPRHYLRQVQLNQRIRSLGISNHQYAERVSLSPLAGYLLLRSVITTYCWEKACEVFSQHPDMQISENTILEDPRLITDVGERLKGSTWQQWYALLSVRLTKKTWNQVSNKFPCLSVALIKNGQWEESFRCIQTKYIDSDRTNLLTAIRAAALAGNWEIAFRFFDLHPVIRNFDVFPRSITTPLISIFGLRWYDNGKRLGKKIHNDVFTSLSERAQNHTYLKRLLHLEMVECFMEDEEQNIYQSALRCVSRSWENSKFAFERR